MIVSKGHRLLLLRCRQYKEHDFVKEHNAISAVSGNVWLLKAGRAISPAKLKDVMDESRCLVLKQAKADGGNYYWAELMNVYEGFPQKDMNYPSYYSDMLFSLDGNYSKLAGTWLQIGLIHRLPNGYENKLLLIKNEKTADEILKRKMSSTLYVFANEQLILDENDGGEGIDNSIKN